MADVGVVDEEQLFEDERVRIIQRVLRGWLYAVKQRRREPEMSQDEQINSG